MGFNSLFPYRDMYSIKGVALSCFREGWGDLRLLVLSLAPLADDMILTKCILFYDALMIVMDRAQAVAGGKMFSSDVQLFPSIMHVVFIVRGAIFVGLAVWAMFQRTATRVQALMWHNIALLMLNILDSVAYAIHAAAFIISSAAT